MSSLLYSPIRNEAGCAAVVGSNSLFICPTPLLGDRQNRDLIWLSWPGLVIVLLTPHVEFNSVWW